MIDEHAGMGHRLSLGGRGRAATNTTHRHHFASIDTQKASSLRLLDFLERRQQ